MPTNVIRHRIHYSGNGVPSGSTGFASLQSQDTYQDKSPGGKCWRWDSTKWVEDNNVYSQPSTGTTIAPKVTVSETVTLPYGNPAQVIDVSTTSSEVKLKFSIPTGAPGSSGGGTGSSAIFIEVTPNGVDDTANLQSAINISKTTGKPIVLAGTYKISNSLSVAKDHYNLVIHGNWAKIQALNSSFTSFINRVSPTDNSDALVMTNAKYGIYNLQFVGYSTQIALNMGPSYGSEYKGIWGDGLKEVIHLRFALRTIIDNCFAINCLNGFIVDMGNWTGADNANSQSNHTSITNCRVYMPSNGQVGYGIYAASGCSVRDCIIEGFAVTRGIDFDGKNSTVVKDFTVFNTHFECVNGATEAFIKVRILGGTVTIDKCFGQHASLFLDASSTSGLGFISVSNVPWWVSKNGKYFTTSNVSLDFKYNEAFYDDAYTKAGNQGINPSFWTGTAPRLYGLNGNDGYHCYTVTRIPR